MLQGILDTFIDPNWTGRRQKKQAKDDLADRYKSAVERSERATRQHDTVCDLIQKKIKKSDTATAIAIKFLGSEFVCKRVAPGDRKCDGCPWERDCPLFAEASRSLVRQSEMP